MKYLKTFEGLNRKTVDPNEIYVFNIGDNKEPLYLVGKININDNDYAPKMSGYVLNDNNYFKRDDNNYYKKGDTAYSFIKKQYWRTIRVATDEEKEFYEYYSNINKYNV